MKTKLLIAIITLCSFQLSAQEINDNSTWEEAVDFINKNSKYLTNGSDTFKFEIFDYKAIRTEHINLLYGRNGIKETETINIKKLIEISYKREPKEDGVDEYGHPNSTQIVLILSDKSRVKYRKGSIVSKHNGFSVFCTKAALYHQIVKAFKRLIEINKG